jgi:peptidyl-prolyl cis-trans isomerase A (cyclophilin A)
MRILAATLLAACAAIAQNPLLKPAALNARAPDTYKVKLATTRGEMTMAVTRAWSPLGADRFYNLVKNGFYNGSAFHRVMPGFVAQFGINSNPAVQAKWRDQKMKDEPVKRRNTMGIVSFAADGADSRTTQVFINLKDNSSLDRIGFTPFGDVVRGVGVAALLYSAYHDKPDPERIMKLGAAYLKRSFPKLDYVKTAALE